MGSLRRALWALAAVGLVAGLVSLAVSLTGEHVDSRALPAVFGPLVGWAFIGTGLFAWSRRPENRFGALMTGVGFAWFLGTLSTSDVPGIFVVGLMARAVPYAILVHMLLAFPSGRLATPFERFLAGLAYFDTTVLQVVWVFFLDSTEGDADCSRCPANPLLLSDSDRLFDLISVLQVAIAVLGLTALVIVLVRRWLRATRVQRAPVTPVLVAGGFVSALLSVSLVADLTPFPDAIEEGVDVAGLVALTSVPFGFLAGLLRSRLSRAGAVSELVARLGEAEDRRGRLRDALAEALGDPSLTLVYWIPGRGVYVDAAGRPVTLPDADPERVCTPVDNDGERVAAILHDASLSNERELVRAVGAAAALTLQNERLEAELRARVEELQASRARLVEAGARERRRVERDLHDGAQQRLVALALDLRLARSRLDDDPVAAGEMLDGLAEELRQTIDELRELARGIHPAVLSDRGLGPALEGLARRTPLPVEVHELPAGRLPAPVEATAYFVVAEALTNVVKYSRATHATVRAAQDDGHLVIEVADDGVGGADPTRGSGLLGLADRLSSLDGQLELEGGRGGGTVVRADIPIGPGDRYGAADRAP